MDSLLLCSASDMTAEEERCATLQQAQQQREQLQQQGTQQLQQEQRQQHQQQQLGTGAGGPTLPAGPLDTAAPASITAMLRSESAAPLLGYLVHACLATAEAEMGVGEGSRALRMGALELLRRLIQVS